MGTGVVDHKDDRTRFCLQLIKEEHDYLRSQIATSSEEAYGGRQCLRYVFTKSGTVMISVVIYFPQFSGTCKSAINIVKSIRVRVAQKQVINRTSNYQYQ